MFQTNVAKPELDTEGPKPQSSNSTGGMLSRVDNRKAREGSIKKRRTSSAKQEPESSSMSDDETFLASPCLVTLGPGVRISTVAAGGRHTLALSGKFSIPWVTAAHTSHSFQV